ncbi:MAG: DMT family transporter [Elusimicrobia bacterium]|nr:DMT family transporter [Elusimicrobiota bacterium]
MSPLLLDLGLVFCALIWGSTFIMVKDTISAVDPAALVGWRFVLSAACLLPWALRRPRPSRHLREGILLGGILLVLYVTQTAGLRWTTASNSAFITGLFVLFVPLFLLLFLKRPPTRVQWGSTALALGGLWLLTGGPAGFNRGDALTLLAAGSYAAHLLATDAYVKADADPLLLAFHQFWACGLGAFAIAAARGAPLGVATPRAWGEVCFLTLLPNVAAFFIQMTAQRTVAPLKVSLIFSLEPVFGALFAWTVGGEAFSERKAAGGLLILLATVSGELSKLPALRGRKKEVLPA